MSYRHLLTLLGVVLIVLGMVERSWFLVAVWLGCDFLILGVAHGRTGLFALAVLLSSGAARSVEDGLQMLSAARPAIRLSREQHRCIQMYAQDVG